MNIKIDTISKYAMIFTKSQYPYKYIYIHISMYDCEYSENIII